MMGGWINTEDILPKSGQLVLGDIGLFFPRMLSYADDKWLDLIDGQYRSDLTVFYWMPLPKTMTRLKE